MDLSNPLAPDSTQTYLSNITTPRWADYKITGYDQLRNSTTLAPDNELHNAINAYYTYLDFLKESNPIYYIPWLDKLRTYALEYGAKPIGFDLSTKDRTVLNDVIKDELFRSHLMYLKESKQRQITIWSSFQGDINHLLSMLQHKNYIYEIGIVSLVGTATGYGWDHDVNMKKVGSHTWELEIELGAGEVKFRADGSWHLNWGNFDFPIDKGYDDGPNIKVQPGKYLVKFNDTSGEYQFIAQ